MGYAAPIGNSDPASGLTAADMPSDWAENLLSNMANLTVMLTTHACGRDLYSPLVTCADCAAAYRNWLCAISLPRCAEYTTTTSSLTAAATITPALSVLNASSPRNQSLPAFTDSYTVVQPCIEVCNAADRACPPFLGFRCPLPQYTASQSYGVGFIDASEEGVVAVGSTGAGTDRWGNVWCNAPGVV